MHGSALLVAVVVLGTLAIGPAAPRASAAGVTPPWMSLSTNATFPVAGDTVGLEVQIFDFSNPVTANATPTIVATWGSAAIDVSTVVQVGAGDYRASLVLPTTGTPGAIASPDLIVVATVDVGGVALSAYQSIEWYTPGPVLRLYANVTTIAPIQPMHLTAELYNDTVPADADPGTVLFSPSGSAAPPIPGNRTAVGVYEANLTLDSRPIGFHGVTVTATYHGTRLVQMLQTTTAALAYPHAGFISPHYQAWYHLIWNNGTVARGELWVADDEGRAAAGVTVNLTTTPILGYANGTTDSQGRLPLTVPVAYGFGQVTGTVGGTSPMAVPVYGTFPSDACLSGMIYPASVPVAPTDPPILPDGSLRDFLQPGTEVARHLRAEPYPAVGPDPYGNRAVGYAVVGLASGRVYSIDRSGTDADGLFTIIFTVPPEDFVVRLEFLAMTGVSVVQYAVASPSMGLQVTPLALSGPTTIHAALDSRAQRFAYAGGLLATASVAFLSDSGERWDDWGPGLTCSWDRLQPAAGGMSLTMNLPSFLPANGSFVIDASSGPRYGTDQFVLLSVGQSANIPVGGPGSGGLPGPLIVLAVIGVVVAALAALGVIVMLRRRREIRPPTSLPPTPPYP